jgi:hypothetical protein
MGCGHVLLQATGPEPSLRGSTKVGVDAHVLPDGAANFHPYSFDSQFWLRPLPTILNVEFRHTFGLKQPDQTSKQVAGGGSGEVLA